jgi:hypothetical protein
MYCVRTLFPTKLEFKTDNGPSLLCLCCGFPPPGLDLSTSNLAGALTIELRRGPSILSINIIRRTKYQSI